MALEVVAVGKSYPRPGRGLFGGERVAVLRGVDFSIGDGEAVALAGESGAGKSTLARLVLSMEKPDCGSITLRGEPVMDRKVRRRHLSAVFQDYASSINPGHTAFDAIAEPLRLVGLGRGEIRRRVAETMERMELESGLEDRRPHELSGGQIQRICLARAVIGEPSLIVLDEAVNSLDAPIQTSLLDLLAERRKSAGIACLFITHDLRAAAYLCDRVLFLEAGRIVEEAGVSELGGLASPYARKLLRAAMPQ